ACKKVWVALPTPAGVPVSTTSPGYSVNTEDSCEICSATLKIMSLVLASCLICPFTLNRMPKACGSGTNEAGTRLGPTGLDPVKHLCASQSKRNGEPGCT